MAINHFMLDPQADPRIAKLFAYGHFANPAYPNANNVTEDDLPNLSLADEAVKEAAKSYQEFFQTDLNELCKGFHNRPCNPDGDVGLATSKLLDMPRCGVPEYGGREEARWPDQCKDGLEVSYLFDSMEADLSRQCWKHMVKAWNAAVEIKLVLQSQFSRDTHIWATDGPLPGSTLAWSMLAQGTCSQNAEQRYDTTQRWSFNLLAGTMVHEVGHALGMGHLNTRSAIMYPSIVGHIVPQAPDIEYMQRLGYRNRTTPLPPEEPTPPAPGVWSGELKHSSGQRITLVGIPS